ncbi:Phosphatidylserine decarboxylase [Komagataella phaffii]|nr:GQ67_04266T0 [Komagataella phaffii]AOA69114.1 GQ68_04238T0 [Komagataella phaffii GS115]
MSQAFNLVLFTEIKQAQNVKTGNDKEPNSKLRAIVRISERSSKKTPRATPRDDFVYTWNSTISLKLRSQLKLPLIQISVWDKQAHRSVYVGEVRFFLIGLLKSLAYNEHTSSWESTPQWYQLYSSEDKKSFSSGTILVQFRVQQHLSKKNLFFNAKSDVTLSDQTGSSDLLNQYIQAIETSTPRSLQKKAFDLSNPNEQRFYPDIETNALASSILDCEIDSMLEDFTYRKPNITESSLHDDTLTDTDFESIHSDPTIPSSALVPKSKVKTNNQKKKFSLQSDNDVLGILFIEILSVTDLPPYKSFTRATFDMDPFVVISFGKRTYRTSWRKHTLTPVFNERLAFEVCDYEKNYDLQFSVLDKDKFSFHDQVATGFVSVSELLEEKTTDKPCTDFKPTSSNLILLDKPMNANESADNLLDTKKKKYKRNVNTDATLQGGLLRKYELVMSLDGKKNWSRKTKDEYIPILKFNTRFERYEILRRQLWMHLLQGNDTQMKGTLDLIELNYFVDCLGSNLSDKTLASFFEYYDKNPWVGETLTIEQVIDSLERLVFKRQCANTHENYIINIDTCPLCGQGRLSLRQDLDILKHLSICASRDWSTVNKVLKPSFVSSKAATRRWYSRLLIKLTFGQYTLGGNSANILIQDRDTGYILEEKMNIHVRLGIKLLYKSFDKANSRKIKTLLRKLSIRQGIKFDSPSSVSQIPSFIKFHKLDVDDCLLQLDEYKTFNEFFYRKLKPGSRPQEDENNSNIATSPADCRCTVFESITFAKTFWIKGRNFTTKKLFGSFYSREMADLYDECSIGIFRLAPQDYHRFHSPVTGTVGKVQSISGEYFTVNPMAIRSDLDVFGENVRCLLPIQTKEFGRVLVVPVGAMMVGSIILSVKENQEVKKGDELGYFKFGGSTLLVLFPNKRFKFDSDLLANSNNKIETLIKVGMSIGHTPEEPQFERHYRSFEEEPVDQQLRIIRCITGGSTFEESKQATQRRNELLGNEGSPQEKDLQVENLSWEAKNMNLEELEENESLLLYDLVNDGT